MDQPGPYGGHRDKDGEISRKHGNTLVSTLRQVYGPTFAAGFAPHAKLSDVLAATGESSLSQLHRGQLHRDHDAGALDGKIAPHGTGTVRDEVAADQDNISKGAI